MNNVCVRDSTRLKRDREELRKGKEEVKRVKMREGNRKLDLQTEL